MTFEYTSQYKKSNNSSMYVSLALSVALNLKHNNRKLQENKIRRMNKQNVTSSFQYFNKTIIMY